MVSLLYERKLRKAEILSPEFSSWEILSCYQIPKFRRQTYRGQKFRGISHLFSYLIEILRTSLIFTPQLSRKIDCIQSIYQSAYCATRYFHP